ncbi:sigma-70 family RNA polymerase sigma factor [Variovorax sp. J22R24]|uniref:RNA polymerase sigma factor n=1 Tax=Variovorax gracilis TaxID=3053502 RepID=UPI0025767A21|nr:sigma-70 family RNA polymerase sigma factor [Variovorax sp. J22R24]MDM0105196.1 sigma-70 family RNA polymerase sigma factor [Variovorax sp. J22R24]
MREPTAIPSLDDALPDDELMLAYAGGEPSAFDALYARNERALYRFVRRLLGIRFAGEVDEVFQEIWMRVSVARDSFSPQDVPWRVWAFTIAHNLAMDRLRLSGREVAFYAHDEDGDGLEAAQIFSRGLLSDHGGAANDAARPSEEELAFWRAAGRRLLACLDELPIEQRAAFLLHHEDGFTVEALTGALDVGSETVRKRLRSGLKKLRGCMERYLSVLEQGIEPSEDSPDDLSDAHLWQALEYAPDQNTAPDWRLRKAMLKRASEAVGAADPEEAEAELELAARPWWRRIGPSDGKRSRVPLIAGLATVLVATLVSLLWRREPVIPPQIDSRPQASAPVPQAVESTASQRPGPGNPAPSRDASSASQASAPPPASPEPQAPPVAESNPPATPVAPAPPPMAKVQKTPPATSPQPPPPRRESADVAKSAPPVAPAPPSAGASSRPTPPESPGARPRKEDDAMLAQRSDNAARPQAPGAPAAGAPAAARVAPPSSRRTEATEPPTFAALSQWSRITITRRGGESRTFQRAEARDLNALLGSAAISAVGAQPLSGTPEYRVTLERDREVLAVFEVAPTQVRWREGKTPSATGVPSAPALAALRAALRDAVQEPLVTPVPGTAPVAAPPRSP